MTTLGWAAVAVLAATLAVTVAALRGDVGPAGRRRASAWGPRHAGRRRGPHGAGAAALARQAGVGEPDGEPPRVLLEPVTGPLVKAVVWSAGARRAATRLVHSVRSAPR